ncbi:hypothetical protein GOEFS_071_00240 [Gordonia effusa NBRC 100432]|uniref:Uncharacterized protein n=1 Tax=Gordonia effusa NBRC 100432 TaxID=1077974 RepID=H0R1M9_9ACTN|nr:hypothetical protein GOEFS_071_00240 [Gordonia effusa NBRC 100432]
MLPAFTFDLPQPWEIDEPTARRSVGFIHIGLINPEEPSTRIELREQHVTAIEPEVALRAAYDRLAVDELVDRTIADAFGSQTSRVGEFLVSQVVMFFDELPFTSAEAPVQLELQLTAPPPAFERVLETFATMVETVRLSPKWHPGFE